MGLDMCMGKPGKDISISGLSNRKAGRAVGRTEDGEKEQLWDGEEGQSFGSGGLFSLKPTSVDTQRRCK